MKLNKCIYCQREAEQDFSMGVYSVYCITDEEDCEMNHLEYLVPVVEGFSQEVGEKLRVCWNSLNPVQENL